MLPLAPALLVAAASAGRRYLTDPEGVRFVNHVGRQSHWDHAARKTSWPLPLATSCDALAAFAQERKILRQEPEEGDVFLVYDPSLRRFMRTGVVVAIHFTIECLGHAVFHCTTVEGGETTRRNFRTAAGDRFIHWVDLEWRAHAA